MWTEEEKFSVGFFFGLLAAEWLSKGAEPFYIEDQRIHHYWASLGVLYTDNSFVQGFALGVGIHDLPDFLADLNEFLQQLWRRLKGDQD